MVFLAVSFIAGILTVLAPCVLPVLPVVIGSSIAQRSRNTPYIVVLSLAVSIIVCTYILKVSSIFVMVPEDVWSYISGGIILIFGIILLLPSIWDSVPGLARISIGSNKLLGAGYQKKTLWGDILIGASLGPIFSTCSPTYFIILASVLPSSFTLGTIYLLAYVVGLSLMLLLIAVLGQRFASKLEIFSNPTGLFKKILGVCFVVLGFLIIVGYEKKLETQIITSGYFDVTLIEHTLINRTQ